jgi:hypothetical protein
MEAMVEPESVILWRYAPADAAHQGAFIVGIPARDLTAADLAEYGVDEDVLAESCFYERVEAPTPGETDEEYEEAAPLAPEAPSTPMWMTRGPDEEPGEED